MTVVFHGGCYCGKIRYICRAVPTATINCHCRDCQRLGGGAYAPIVVVPLQAVTITQGELKRHATARLNGRENVRGFCASCGSRLTVGENPARNIVGLLAASLDDPSEFRPTMDIFTEDAQPWDTMDANLPKHRRHAPAGEGQRPA